MKSFVLSIFLALMPATALAQEPSFRVFSTGDGDTLRVESGEQRLTVRLACIDAPERKQAPFGAIAAARLAQLLPVGSTVQLRVITRDRYKRTIAEVYSNGHLINLALVREGQAFVHPDYIHQCDRSPYLAAEATAKREQLGVWNQATPVQPWEFRRQETLRRRSLQ